MANAVLTLVVAFLAAIPTPPDNRPPVAVNDEVLVMGYTDYLEIPVFANDWDPDGDALTVVAVLPPTLGKAILLKGGAAGIAPDWSLLDERKGPSGPVLIAHGGYIVSDGAMESKAEWFVWH